MVNKNKNLLSAYSIAAAIITITVLAVATAALTPTLTRKLVNVKEFGSALGGGTHGRFEAYIKEVICFGGECYIKTDPQLTMTVYERLSDDVYKEKTGNDPQISNNRKSTLYKELSATPIINSDGSITTAKLNGSTITKGNQYIFEPKLTYTCANSDGTVKSSCTAIKPDSSGSGSKRVIEGNLTTWLKKDSGNNLWLFEISTSAPTVTPVPWITQYSGTHKVRDEKAPDDITFTPPENASNIVIHAVGGGGAGGGVSGDGGYLLSSLNDTEINYIKAILLDRLKAVKGSVNSSDVQIGSCSFTEGSWWVCLDKAKSMLYAKTDLRYGYIYPNELLDYTKILGAQTQPSLVYSMPNWFDMDTIRSSGYCVGAAVQGGKGGDAATFTWRTNNQDGSCCDEGDDRSGVGFRSSQGVESCSKAFESFTGNQDGTHYYGCDEDGHHCKSKKYDKTGTCTADSISSDYYGLSKTKSVSDTLSDNKKEISGGTYSSPASLSKCGSYYTCRNDEYFERKYPGSQGGAKPDVAYIAYCPTNRADIVTALTASNGNDGSNGTACTGTTGSGADFVTQPYKNCRGVCASAGKTGKATLTSTKLGTKYAYSYGSTAGKAYGAGSSSYSNSCSYQERSTCGYYTDEDNVEHLYTCCCHNLTDDFASIANSGTSPTDSNGTKGSTTDSVNENGCNCKYYKGTTGSIYNYVYIWAIPFTMNQLSYGEGGSVGEYTTTKVSKFSGELAITLGKGGARSNSASWNDIGKNGEDTTVKDDSKTIVTAKGGKGGKATLKTNKYDLCFNSPSGITSTCANSAGNGGTNNRNTPKYSNSNSVASGVAASVACCNGSELSKSTKEILSTAIKYSGFENIKSLAGSSNIVGIGLGRSGEGAGSISGKEELTGTRSVYNANKSQDNGAGGRILNQSAAWGTTQAAASDYKNTLLRPSALNFKGGDGAVIITW